MYSTDPLIFTCELSYAVVLRVVLPNNESHNYHESVSIGDTYESVNLSAGFTAVSLNISQNDAYTRNISLELSITNASFLNGGEIKCDDTTSTNEVMAGCPVCGKS